jgi:hypothetical protein
VTPDPTIAAALGARFVEALAARDGERLAAVLHPEVDFRGLTPSRTWEARDPAAVLDIVLGTWFEPSDELDELVLVERDAFADRATASTATTPTGRSSSSSRPTSASATVA